MSISLCVLILVMASLVLVALCIVLVGKRVARSEDQTAPTLRDELSLSQSDDVQPPTEAVSTDAVAPIGEGDEHILRVEDMQLGDTFHLHTVNGSRLIVTLIDKADGVFTLRYLPGRHHPNKPLRAVRAALITSVRTDGFHLQALVPGYKTVWIRLASNLQMTTSPITRVLRDIPQAT